MVGERAVASADEAGLAALRVDEAPVAALDFETTGLEHAAGHRVVEVGVVRLDPRQGLRREVSALVQPGVPINQRTQRIHGISDAMVQAAPPFGAVLGRVAPLLEGAVLLAHNAPFDLGFLRAECARAGLAVPAFGAVVDTLTLARHVFRLPSCGLGAVADRVGLHLYGAHRALADARATQAVFREMMRTLAQERGHTPTVGELLELMAVCRADNAAARTRERLRLAAQTGQTITIYYTSFRPEGRLTTPRPITILALKSRRVDAFCHLRGARRTFRIDRIRNVSLSPVSLDLPGTAAGEEEDIKAEEEEEEDVPAEAGGEDQ